MMPFVLSHRVQAAWAVAYLIAVLLIKLVV